MKNVKKGMALAMCFLTLALCACTATTVNAEEKTATTATPLSTTQMYNTAKTENTTVEQEKTIYEKHLFFTIIIPV